VTQSKWMVSMLAVATLVACGGGTRAELPATKAPSAAVAALLLPQAPSGGLGVDAAKAKGAAAQVVVTGRIASTVRGLAAFTLMDSALPYCGEKNKEDNCKTPWDYCCESPETYRKHALVVEARGADGKPLPSPSLGDLRLLDQVAVVGQLVVDEHGNHTVLATGWYREQRPNLPADTRWPE
jgi:hypothetical protein